MESVSLEMVKGKGASRSHESAGVQIQLGTTCQGSGFGAKSVSATCSCKAREEDSEREEKLRCCHLTCVKAQNMSAQGIMCPQTTEHAGNETQDTGKEHVITSMPQSSDARSTDASSTTRLCRGLTQDAWQSRRIAFRRRN